MKKVLWIINKYVHGKREQVYYPRFLLSCQNKMNEHGYQLMFVFCSNQFRSSATTDNNFFYDNACESTSKEKIQSEADRIEREYNFTFKQAYFADVIQVSKSQNLRKIRVPEWEFNEQRALVCQFLYLERIIIENEIDVCFCDQSPECQMEFGRSICLRYRKIFLRHTSSFLGRANIHQQFEFGKERLVEAVHSNIYTKDTARDFIDDFVTHKRAPYRYYKPYRVSNDFSDRIKNLFSKKRPGALVWFAFCYPLKLLKRSIFRIYLLGEGLFLKKFIERKYERDQLYLFYGLHLTTESTVTLRSQPYTDQISLIETISRVLPYGYKLYVREHPDWRSQFSFWQLLRLNQIPNVRLISPKIPVADLIINSKGIITCNGTMGIEALMYGRPVLSLAPNVYYKHHPSVQYCADLFELGSSLVKLINTPVSNIDTIEYIQKMFSITSDVLIESDSFHTVSDAERGAEIVAQHLCRAIDWCATN